ncbi:hypothetical protein Lal_00018781 [Lupinus albus]|uniref:Putative expansin/Lol pI n=1 Tax=Lupinus albus TaxID=3870 RepID=A0A6A4PP23_LUPAL|nr:putative expansin/Lol pI [Lupinus albus]KAF1868261.1 hypothetical protein Lal_00018781 [Lupinus albus]
MDIVLSYMFSLVILFSVFVNPSYSINFNFFNASETGNQDQWQTATATWYGPPNGAGSDGGNCGYGDSVENPPLSKMISAGGPSLFQGGSGCGACYEVKCTENDACSRNPVLVVITDNCPGCPESVHFDLSGTAFGSMANPGKADQLRNVGQLNNLQYRRVPCNFGKSIAFTIDDGASPYYFATEIEYENGDGNIVEIELKQGIESSTWIPMFRSWGAKWALNPGFMLNPPFSLKLTEAGKGDTKKTIVAENVISINWKPGQVYRSFVNF